MAIHVWCWKPGTFGCFVDPLWFRELCSFSVDVDRGHGVGHAAFRQRVGGGLVFRGAASVGSGVAVAGVVVCSRALLVGAAGSTPDVAYKVVAERLPVIRLRVTGVEGSGKGGVHRARASVTALD